MLGQSKHAHESKGAKNLITESPSRLQHTIDEVLNDALLQIKIQQSAANLQIPHQTNRLFFKKMAQLDGNWISAP